MRIVETAYEVDQIVSGLQSEPRGTLKVSSSFAFGNMHLVHLIPEFLHRYPEIRVEIGLNDRYVDIAEEGFDVCVRLATNPGDILHRYPMFSCKSAAVLRAILYSRTTVTSDLRGLLEMNDRNSSQFTVATAPVFASSLTNIQRALLNAMWDQYLSDGTPYPYRGLPNIIGSQPVSKVIDALIGKFIKEGAEQGVRHYMLTIYGVLLTTNGPLVIPLLVQLLDFVKKSYQDNHFIKELSNAEIKAGLGISESDESTLYRILSIGLPPKIPFYLSSYNSIVSRWDIAITDDVLDLFISKDSASYLDHHLSMGYEMMASSWPELSDEATSTSTANASPQDLDSESGPESGYGNAPYGIGGYGVPSGPGVVGYGTVGQFTASSSTNESALSILSSTQTEIEAESDLLDRKKLTIALYRLLTEREDDYAFAIGLFGHWGTGKSSQIKFIETELNKTGGPRVMVAHFNAWQSESASNLSAMLAQAVVDRLLFDKGFLEKIRLAIQLTLLRQSKTWGTVKGGWRSVHIALSRIGIFLPQLFLLLVLGLIIRWFLVSDLFSNVQSWVAATVATIVAPAVFFASAYHFMRSHLTEWFKHLDLKKSLSIFALPDYSTHRGAVLDIHRTLEDLCSLCLKNNKPEADYYLLLVVDDLDRCKVDTVKDVLDAVRLVANIKRVVTIVAIDERMAFAAVEKHYDQFGHAGRSPDMVARDYLAKVLQVSITLPEITDDGIASYIDQKIFGDIATDEHVPSASPSEGERARDHRNTMIENERNNFDQMQMAPDSMQAPSSHEPISTPLKPRQSPFPKEKELFKILAQTYNFSNPRLLWRHYMAWKLLKSLCLGDTYVEEDIRIPMQLLFWKEWLNQQTVADRKLYSEWMGNAEGQGNPDEKHGQIYSHVKLNLRPHWRQMPEGLTDAVDAVVLPASPQDIASTKGPEVK